MCLARRRTRISSPSTCTQQADRLAKDHRWVLATQTIRGRRKSHLANDRILSDISITWYKRLMPRFGGSSAQPPDPRVPLVLGRRSPRDASSEESEKLIGDERKGGQRLEREQKTVEDTSYRAFHVHPWFSDDHLHGYPIV